MEVLILPPDPFPSSQFACQSKLLQFHSLDFQPPFPPGRINRPVTRICNSQSTIPKTPPDCESQFRWAKMSRSRTGCVTCKQRRVKCDEGQPECRRCTAFGRICGGYQPFRTITFDSMLKTRERQAFHYFCQKGVVDISAGYTQAFWRGTLMHASAKEPAIYHLCNAIGAIYEGRDRFDVDERVLQQNRVFALQQYSKASAMLANSSISKEYLLIACLLFVCFDCLHIDFETSSNHLRGGLDILATTDKSSDFVLRNYIEPLLLSLSLQHAPINETLFSKSRKVLAEDKQSMRSITISTFSTIDEASSTLQRIITGMLKWFDQAQKDSIHLSESSPKRLQIMRLFKEWTIAFENLLRRLNITSPSDLDIVAAPLKIRCRTALILLQTYPFEDEMIFDNFESDFDFIISTARRYVSQMNESKASSTKQGLFVFQTRCLWPLFITGTRCRNPRLRRAAVQILRDYNCQEGNWHSDCLACVVSLVTKIEEQGVSNPQSSADVLRQNRITIIDGGPLGKLEDRAVSHEKRHRTVQYVQLGFLKEASGGLGDPVKEYRVNSTSWKCDWTMPEMELTGEQTREESLADLRFRDLQCLSEARLDLMRICRCL